ncbi:conserved hypothetical protein [Ricinus communis]|uniref:Uncharacterized protein n=1 Tax=Ricinus communis TaxID=3988 RepID=B9TLX3_RICCO|nr:conserved hypothetical protein [Ricinus communis]
MTLCCMRARRRTRCRSTAANAKSAWASPPILPARTGAHDEPSTPLQFNRPGAALDHGPGHPGDAVRRRGHGGVAAPPRRFAGTASSARHGDPAAGPGAPGQPPDPADAAVAGRPAADPETGGARLALAAVRPDAGHAADRLGHAVGRRLSHPDVRRRAPAGHPAARSGAVWLAAPAPRRAGLCAVPDHPCPPGRGAVSRLGAARRSVRADGQGRLTARPASGPARVDRPGRESHNAALKIVFK